MSILTITYICKMEFLKSILNFYIFSNFHVAIAGFCITKVTVIKYDIYDSYVPLFVGLSIVISYNFIRFYELKSGNLSWFKDWFFKYKMPIIFLCIFSVLALFFILFFSNFNAKSLLLLIPFGLMTFFYVIPILKFKNMEISFRNFPSAKIFSIALAWAGISVFFPIFEAKHVINFDVFLEFIQRFAILIAITLPFDIRDLNFDSKNLKTLPQILGVVNCKVIGVLILFFAIFLELFKSSVELTNIIILVCISVITGLFLLFSTENRKRNYTSFWVESIPIMWLILTVLI